MREERLREMCIPIHNTHVPYREDEKILTGREKRRLRRKKKRDLKKIIKNNLSFIW